jgi:hypothetical protein
LGIFARRIINLNERQIKPGVCAFNKNVVFSQLEISDCGVVCFSEATMREILPRSLNDKLERDERSPLIAIYPPLNQLKRRSYFILPRVKPDTLSYSILIKSAPRILTA